MIKFRKISLLQLRLLQDRLNGDIGTFAIRIERGEFLSDQTIVPGDVRQNSLGCTGAFDLPLGGYTDHYLHVRFEKWKPGSVEIRITLCDWACSSRMLHRLLVMDSNLAIPQGAGQFRQDLTDNGSKILAHAKIILLGAQILPPPVVPTLASPMPSKLRKPRASRSPK